MSGFLAGLSAIVVFGFIVMMIFQFCNVTLWQCYKFDNCPWYLNWLK